MYAAQHRTPNNPNRPGHVDSVGSAGFPCMCNPVGVPSFRVTRGPTIVAAMVVRNEAERLVSLLPLLHRSRVFLAIIVVVQTSTDDSVAVAEREGCIVVRDSRVGYSELSAPTLSAAVASTRAEWVLQLDVDEQPSTELLLALHQLASTADDVDGFVLTRCNTKKRAANSIERKYRFYRRGRVVPNTAFGTQALRACPRCWRKLPLQCALLHNKSKAERKLDGRRYSNICKQACERDDVDIPSKFPDCWWLTECAKHFTIHNTSEVARHPKRPLQAAAARLGRMRASEIRSATLAQAHSRCAWNKRLARPDAESYLARAHSVMAGRALKASTRRVAQRFLPHWRGQMIFVANAGRSGSKYLAALWRTVEDTVAVHEEPPTMDVGCGGTMDVPLEATYETRLLKVAAIEKLVDEASTRRQVRFYAESNPNFKNSFADVVLNELAHINITVVVLQRHVPSIARSLLEIGWMKSRKAGGHGASSFDWMPTTASVNSFAHSHLAHDIAGPRFDHPLRLLANYIVNVAATSHGLEALYGSRRNVRFVRYRSEDLFTRAGALALLRLLGMQPTLETYHVLGNVVDHFKGHAAKTTRDEMNAVDREIRAYIAQARRAIGVARWPPMPHLLTNDSLGAI